MLIALVVAASTKVAASLKVKRILEVLFPEKKSSAFWKYCSRKKKSSAFWKYCSRKKRWRESKSRRESKSKAHFASTVPGKKSQANFGSTVPGKNIRSYRGRALQRWPNFTFFLFYFSGYSTSILLFFHSTESPGLCLKIILLIFPQCHKFKFKNYKHCMWKILSIFLLIRVCCHLASVS